MEAQNVYTTWKEVGETPKEALERLRDKERLGDMPMTYAGRLDPMAEGLLLILVGEECKRKRKYLELDKEYEGEILLGFSTDTGDILGIPTVAEKNDSTQKVSDDKQIYSEILKNLRINEEGGEKKKTCPHVAETVEGKKTQKYPAYSSKTVGGKPLWQWAREGSVPPQWPENEIEVYSFEIVDQYTNRHSHILQNVRMSVSRVKGNFRQEEILKQWEEVLGTGKNKEALILKFKTRVSSGTYIRLLAEEVGELFGTHALLYSLTRTRVGEYTAT